MFANRRKRQQLNKANYYSNRANNLVKANGPVEQLIIYERVDPPVGSIMAYTVNASPTGWLVCDGSSVNKEAYSKLYEVIGNTFGGNALDASFNLPDYRGAFLRGIGTHNGYAGPSNISSYQAHATQTHNHTATSSVTDNQHAHTQYTLNDDYNFSGGIPTGTTPSYYFSDSSGNRIWSNINFASSNITVSTSIGDSTTNVNPTETRPYNYGVYWIIKY
jgi:microcystin-dependent protein